MDAFGVASAAVGLSGIAALCVVVFGGAQGADISAEDLAPYRNASINVDTASELRRVAEALGLSASDAEPRDGVLQSGQKES